MPGMDESAWSDHLKPRENSARVVYWPRYQSECVKPWASLLCVATNINYNSHTHVPFKMHTIPIFCYFLTLEGPTMHYLESLLFDPVGNKLFTH